MIKKVPKKSENHKNFPKNSENCRNFPKSNLEIIITFL